MFETSFGVSKLIRRLQSSSESTLVKISHCWKPNVVDHIINIFNTVTVNPLTGTLVNTEDPDEMYFIMLCTV